MRKRAPDPKPRVILAFDPGEAAGVALIFDGELWGWGPANGASWRGLFTVARPLADNFLYIPTNEKVCIIEDGWIDKSRGGKGQLTLARRRGLAQAAGEACGFERFNYVGSSTWQNQLFGSIYKQDTKELSLAYCASRWNVFAETHDVADAICLASWLTHSCNMV